MSPHLRIALVVALALTPASACENRPTENVAVTPAASEHPIHSLAPSDVRELKRATDRFHRLRVARSEGYAIFGGCFSDPTLGGMGQHFANDALIADPAIKLRQPELLLYDVDAKGRETLIAVEYIVFVDEWHAAGNPAPPRLFGTEFHINSTLLPKPFYLLHAWVWQDNPSGLLSDWNPQVSCQP